MRDDRIVRLDDLQIDLGRQQVERAGVQLALGGLSFRLLAYLLGQGDRVVGFDELIEAVWAPAVVGEETVTQRVKLLRQALGDDGRRPRYIRSVRGQGYQLCATPRVVAAESQVVSSRSWKAWTRWMPALVGLLVIAFAGILASSRRDAVRAPVTRPGAAASPAGETELQRARYYARIGQDANNERAIALYETVLSTRPENVDARLGLSRALSARMCLYNRGAGSIERAESLARAVLERDADNSAAHDALAYAYDCRGLIDSAIAEYERAVALEPVARFDSRASVAYLYMVKGRLADALQANVEIADHRGDLRFYDIQVARNLELLGFVAEAERRYAQSFRLYPDSVYSNAAWPRCLYLQGRLAEAEAALDQALQRPLHPELQILRGELALLRGERNAAHAAFAQAHALRPGTSWPDTLMHLHVEGSLDQDWMAAQATRIHAAIAAGERAPDMFIELGMLELGRARREAALDALDAAIAAGFTDRAYLQISPLFHELAGEPRMAAAIDRIGQQVARERGRVLAADWLPPDLLSAVRASP